MYLNFRCFCLVMAIVMVAACTKRAPQLPHDEVTVQLKWFHQAQFAGFYVAQEKGYYAQENLKVNFLEGGPDVDITAPLLSGNAQFGLVAPEVVMIKRRKMNLPITAIAAIFQRSATVYISKKGSGITTPEDFQGKTIAALSAASSAGEFEFQFKAMMKKLGLDASQSRLVPYDPSYKAFLNGDVDITAAYITSGVIKLRKMGEKINLIWPGDFGIHFYSDTLITTEKMLDQNPEIVERFVRATLKGWEDAIGDSNAAVDATLKFARNNDRQFQTRMLNTLRPLVHTGEHRVGWMQGDIWEQMHQVLLENRILPGPIDQLDQVFTKRYLNAIYGKPNS